MPELPELEIYRERLDELFRGAVVESARLYEPFALRTVEPPLTAIVGARCAGFRRRGKHLLVDFENAPTVAIHLMLAGRLHRRDAAAFTPHRRRTLLALRFADSDLLEMTEAGTTRRARVLVLDPAAPLPGSIDRGREPFDPTLNAPEFAALLRRENRQIKNALRDPATLSGIGNAYADEILWAARLSPLRTTSRLDDAALDRLFTSMRESLEQWIETIRRICAPGTLPVKQDLWRKRMAVHGRTGHACPACDSTIAVVSFADSDTNYCPRCQNGGRLLADRRLSRLGIRREPKRLED
ncbi:MAG: DNA-formamidopyrimidine glycosylase family protein [bacterium]